MKRTTDGIAMIRQFARLDLHRHERTGVPEVVFAENKTPEQVVAILERLAQKSGVALATRVSAEAARKIRRKLGKNFVLEHNVIARTLVARSKSVAANLIRGDDRAAKKFRGYKPLGCVAILAAGTADIAVAEEARITAELMGCKVLRFYDVGIAGIHRLVQPLREILAGDVNCIVVAAGMEGALPSVVRGLVHVPVIGVPVSSGYGYGGRGEAALMTMLQSCSPGLTVVNVDNGFGAGATAALIANQVAANRMRAWKR